LRKLDFKAYLKVPRDGETVTRSVIRKLHNGYRERPHEYISGDSFKAKCDLELNSENWYASLMRAIKESHNSFRFFASGLPKSNTVFDILEFLKKNNNLIFPNVTLVLHNGDQFPSTNEMELVSTRFKEIFSVNWLGTSKYIHPIPIGLENEGYLLNGVLSDYLSMKQSLIPLEKRPIKLLACFSLHTNPTERNKAMRSAIDLGDTYVVKSPITPRKYRTLVSQSVFVLSPPGNGIDCHRTWEALFLGAIPVVKRSFWSFSKYEIGAKVVDDWDEIKALEIPVDIKSLFHSKYSKVDSWLQL
jgi:hypothetical protein